MGARFAPQAILSQLATLRSDPKMGKLISASLCDYASENENYQKAIEDSMTRGQEVWKTKGENTSVLHLGGGHDHIYVLLKILSQQYQKISIINLDPHLDTRTDDFPHSGNPFRRFIKENKKWQGELIQLGINPTHNSADSYKNILGMKVINYDEFSKKTKFFQNELKLEELLEKDYEILVVSLDCDVIESSLMEAVSSVSFKGIPGEFLRRQILHWREESAKSILGIYEYNPLFDNLSNKGSRFLASIIYDWWLRRGES